MNQEYKYCENVKKKTGGGGGFGRGGGCEPRISFCENEKSRGVGVQGVVGGRVGGCETRIEVIVNGGGVMSVVGSVLGGMGWGDGGWGLGHVNQ